MEGQSILKLACQAPLVRSQAWKIKGSWPALLCILDQSNAAIEGFLLLCTDCPLHNILLLCCSYPIIMMFSSLPLLTLMISDWWLFIWFWIILWGGALLLIFFPVKCSADELNRLLTDKDAYNKFLHSLDEVRRLEKVCCWNLEIWWVLTCKFYWERVEGVWLTSPFWGFTSSELFIYVGYRVVYFFSLICSHLLLVCASSRIQGSTDRAT